MIEQLSLTTVQKALTVVNEWLLSFSPSSLSFSFTPSVSSQFAPISFSLYLSLSHSLFEHEEEGRNPLLSSRETFTIGLAVSIEMLVPVFATLSPSSPPSPFFSRCRARGRRHAKIVVTGADRTRGRCQDCPRSRCN